jgi:hypothetical protein
MTQPPPDRAPEEQVSESVLASIESMGYTVHVTGKLLREMVRDCREAARLRARGVADEAARKVAPEERAHAIRHEAARRLNRRGVSPNGADMDDLQCDVESTIRAAVSAAEQRKDAEWEAKSLSRALAAQANGVEMGRNEMRARVEAAEAKLGERPNGDDALVADAAAAVVETQRRYRMAVSKLRESHAKLESAMQSVDERGKQLMEWHAKLLAARAAAGATP